MPTGDEFDLAEWLHWPLFSVVESQAGADPTNGTGGNIDLRAFSYVVGQNIPQAGAISTGRRSATDSDTNQVARSRINHDESFICFSMTYEHWAVEGSDNSNSVYPAGAPDVAATAPTLRGTNLRILQKEVLLQLFVGANINKPMASAPLAYYGQGIGAVAFGSGDPLAVAVGAATALNLDYGTGGSVSPENQRRWQLPVYIHSDRVMYARLRTPNGAGVAGTGSMRDIDQDYQLKVYMDGLKRRPVA